MPLYEFSCSDCGKKFEFLARNSDHMPEACANCGSKNISKLFSAFAVGSSTPSKPAKCETCRAQGSCPYVND